MTQSPPATKKAPATLESFPTMTITPSAFMQSLIGLSVIAGKEIMAIYATDFSAKAKGDLTPVTEADEGGTVPVLLRPRHR